MRVPSPQEISIPLVISRPTVVNREKGKQVEIISNLLCLAPLGVLRQSVNSRDRPCSRSWISMAENSMSRILSMLGAAQ